MTVIKIATEGGQLFTYDTVDNHNIRYRPLCPKPDCGRSMQPAGDQHYTCGHTDPKPGQPPTYPDLPYAGTDEPVFATAQLMTSPFRGVVDVPLPREPIGAGMNGRSSRRSNR